MHVIKVRNVNGALIEGLTYLLACGVREDSRAGLVLVARQPVATVYTHPQERVLFSPARNANPFFHLFESLWLLAGRDDAKWLDQFVHDFSLRFAESDGTLHGSYGQRWRKCFGFDQLDHVVETLKRDPSSRQCVIQMWDAQSKEILVPGDSDFNVYKTIGTDDLRGKWADRPCNTQVYLRVRQQQVLVPPDGGDEKEPVLDITVCCRSNDLWWGAYGANAVQFSFLQEYLAARIGVGIGTYTQLSNNYHLYYDMLDGSARVLIEDDPRGLAYPKVTPIVMNPDKFDNDLRRFMFWANSPEPDQTPYQYPDNPWFQMTAEPLYFVHRLWKQKDRDHAFEVLHNSEQMAQDWKIAVWGWMHRRGMAK